MGQNVKPIGEVKIGKVSVDEILNGTRSEFKLNKKSFLELTDQMVIRKATTGKGFFIRFKNTDAPVFTDKKLSANPNYQVIQNTKKIVTEQGDKNCSVVDFYENCYLSIDSGLSNFEWLALSLVNYHRDKNSGSSANIVKRNLSFTGVKLS